jgi:NADH:ubiquinone oxidoreductase subunit D
MLSESMNFSRRSVDSLPPRMVFNELQRAGRLGRVDDLESKIGLHTTKINELRQRNTVLWFKAMVSGLRHRKCCTRLTGLQEEMDQSERQRRQCASQLKELGRKREVWNGSLITLESIYK